MTLHFCMRVCSFLWNWVWLSFIWLANPWEHFTVLTMQQNTQTCWLLWAFCAHQVNKHWLLCMHVEARSRPSIVCTFVCWKHLCAIVQTLFVFLVCHIFLSSGLHRVEGGKATEVMTFLDNVANHVDPTTPNLFLPRNGEEFRDKINLVFHRPYRIPLRLLEAGVLLQERKYPNFRKR